MKLLVLSLLMSFLSCASLDNDYNDDFHELENTELSTQPANPASNTSRVYRNYGPYDRL